MRGALSWEGQLSSTVKPVLRGHYLIKEKVAY
jgi:hypothetical protein